MFQRKGRGDERKRVIESVCGCVCVVEEREREMAQRKRKRVFLFLCLLDNQVVSCPNKAMLN